MFRTIRKSIVIGLAGGCFAILTPLSARASEPHFLGVIEFAGFNFAPVGWSLCDGQILPINQNQALYSLLGTTFGGDGRTTFALPDLRGRSPIHDGGSAGSGLSRRPLGSRGGRETVALTAAEIPSHTHTLRGSTATGNQVLPTGHAFADDSPDETYVPTAPNTNMQPAAIGQSPSQAHQNMSPYLTINCIIARTGQFPSRN